MSQRVEQLNSLVQQEVSALLIREVEFPLGVFVTVSKVSVSDDAESARVWISVFPTEQAEPSLALIQKRIVHIQHLLNKRLVMKFVPKLIFALDFTEEKVASLNALLDAVADDPTLTPLPKAPPDQPPPSNASAAPTP